MANGPQARISRTWTLGWPHYPRFMDDWLTKRSAKRTGRAALRNYQWRQGDVTEDFGDGFVRAYEDIAFGGTGEPPALPPEKYWTQFYRSSLGRSHAQEWFQGYAAGSAEALGSGWHEHVEVSGSGSGDVLGNKTWGEGSNPGIAGSQFAAGSMMPGDAMPYATGAYGESVVPSGDAYGSGMQGPATWGGTSAPGNMPNIPQDGGMSGAPQGNVPVLEPQYGPAPQYAPEHQGSGDSSGMSPHGGTNGGNQGTQRTQVPRGVPGRNLRIDEDLPAGNGGLQRRMPMEPGAGDQQQSLPGLMAPGVVDPSAPGEGPTQEPSQPGAVPQDNRPLQGVPQLPPQSVRMDRRNWKTGYVPENAPQAGNFAYQEAAGVMHAEQQAWNAGEQQRLAGGYDPAAAYSGLDATGQEMYGGYETSEGYGGDFVYEPAAGVMPEQYEGAQGYGPAGGINGFQSAEGYGAPAGEYGTGYSADGSLDGAGWGVPAEGSAYGYQYVDETGQVIQMGGEGYGQGYGYGAAEMQAGYEQGMNQNATGRYGPQQAGNSSSGYRLQGGGAQGGTGRSMRGSGNGGSNEWKARASAREPSRTSRMMQFCRNVGK